MQRHQECWLNGEFVAESDARISPFDRGFIFGDGVYEVTAIANGRFIDCDRHLQRLERSMREIGIRITQTLSELEAAMYETARRSGICDGYVYIEVTRGVAERDFSFPSESKATIFAFARRKEFLNDPLASGISVVTVPDIRWSRRDIKSISLLGQVLAKQSARERGATEAFMHEGGTITEGSSSTVWMYNEGVLVTRHLSTDILAGVTRSVVSELAPELGIPVIERPFTVSEAIAADEVMITSATTFVLPVTRIDDKVIGNGAAGPVATRIRTRYLERAYGH